jgi:prepilin-type N-terminal cleavage/methylation domain-containing protein
MTHSRRPAWTRGGGFSAVELMAVVAIIGILVLVTTPAFMNFYNSMKVRTAAHRVQSHVRLCRQVAVSRRVNVVMQLQRNAGAVKPTYQAWEEKNWSAGNVPARNPNGVDAVAGTADDENWVVRPENTMAVDKVTFVDSYNDTTPEDALDAPGASVMSGSGLMWLLFQANGQVVRLTAAGGNVSPPDTAVRMRFTRPITRSRVDQWDITVNRAGRVGSAFNRVAP